MEAYKKTLLQRREIRSWLSEDHLASFREAFTSKKRKPDIAKASKYSNKVKAFSVDQVESLISQLDVLNLSKFDNEIVQAIMQYVSEGKRVKESDIPVIARFIVEVVRRYPSTVEMFESFFQDSLKLIGSQNEKAIQSMKKMVFLLYCELCLCGVIGKENVVGKMLKAVIDTVSSKDTSIPIYYDLLLSFIRLYSYEFAGIIPLFLFGTNGTDALVDCPSIVSPTIQSRFLSILESFYSTLLKHSTTLWDSYCNHYRKKLHEEAFRGSITEEIASIVEKEASLFEELKQQLHVVSQYLNHEEPVFEMEEEEKETVGDMLVVHRNDKSDYSGPFADIEEENFYCVVPNLEELVPSLYSKKNKKREELAQVKAEKGDVSESTNSKLVLEQEMNASESTNSKLALEQELNVSESTNSKLALEQEMNASESTNSKLALEQEINAIDAVVTKEEIGEEEEVEDVAKLRSTSITHALHVTDINTNISLQEKSDLLMEQLMTCYSAKEVDDWCLDFCGMNNPVTREKLVETIHSNYIRHLANQPYLARAIKELKPAYDTLGKEVEEFVRNRFYSLTITINGSQLSKLCSVTAFIIELIRFDISKPVLFFYCLRRLWKFRSLESVQVIVQLVEKLGPLLLSKKAIASLVNSELNHIQQICNEKIVDSNCSALLMNAYYICRPTERPRVKRIEIPPQQRYLQYLLNECLIQQKNKDSQEEIASHILKFDLGNMNTLMMVIHEIMKVPTNSFVAVEALTLLCCELNYEYPRFGVVLIDAIYERLMYILDFMPTNCQQEAIGLIEFIFLLYDFRMLQPNTIFFMLYLFIEYGHNVTPDAIEHYSFLPKRPMAVHPFVYYENDSPFMVLRLKMAIKLYNLCFGECKTKKQKTFILYLQRYFLSKAEVDLETIYDYENLMKYVSGNLKKYTTFEEVDAAIAEIESRIVRNGSELKPHTMMLSMQQDDSDLQETAIAQMTKDSIPAEEKVDEIELMFEKKLNEQLKSGTTVNTSKRVNLDGMSIPLNLQSANTTNGFKLLIKNKNGITVGNTVNLEISETEKKQKRVQQEKKKKQAKKLKEKTIRLNTQESEEEPTIQSIHNDRVAVCPQANGRRFKGSRGR